MVKKIRKELKDSGFDCKMTVNRKMHDGQRDTVITSEFVHEVQKIVNNGRSKSMHAIARKRKM